MDTELTFDFKRKLSSTIIPAKLNNPFSLDIPEVAKIAAKEFQEFILLKSKNWAYDFQVHKGKMFGILVVETEDNDYRYLGTVSGKLPGNTICEQFVPSVFDDSVGDYFINKGMTELTEMSAQIKTTIPPSKVAVLKAERKLKSTALQRRLFENYYFLNLSGEKKNILEIFQDSSHGKPPSAAGECAAPKLIHYAIAHGLKPIAVAEFWWGNPNPNLEREHGFFYPACKSKCRPILEYMLEDDKLFDGRLL